MVTAIVDLDINEGSTFIMSLEFWEDVDNTLPIDITQDSFAGSFKIGTKVIPMTVVIAYPAVNVIEATVSYSLMTDLSSAGKYDIEMTTPSAERFRVIQGDVRVNQEVTK